MTRYAYLAVSAVAILSIALFASNRSSEQTSPDSSGSKLTQIVGDANEAISAPITEKDRSDSLARDSASSESKPVELIESVYEQDLDFRQKAIEAAETRAGFYEPGSLLRWGAAYINPKELFPSGYLDDSAMPRQFELSPFPDVKIIADATSFDVFRESQTAVWQGTIRNSAEGTVTVTFAGGEDSPGMVIRIQDGQQYIRIVETTVPNAYFIAEQDGVLSTEFEPQSGLIGE